VSPFGGHVRRWRGIRRMSQLDLAIAAGTTPRHVSFVETGRSRPGKDLVLRIGDALRVPLSERNDLLTAAGFAPAFPAHDLGSGAMESVDRVLDAVLRGHEPCGPGAFREHVRNWADVAQAGLADLRHDAADAADGEGSRLLRRAEALAQPLPPLPGPAGSAPVICPVFAEAFFRARAAR